MRVFRKKESYKQAAWWFSRAWSDTPEDRGWAAKIARRIHRLPLFTTTQGCGTLPMTRRQRNRQARTAIATLIGPKWRPAA